MTSVLVSGYYGAANFGDEAMLDVILRTIRNAGCTPTVLSIDPTRTRVRFGCEAVDRRDTPARLAAVRRADWLLFGGGGLIKSPGPETRVGVSAAMLDPLVAGLAGTGLIVYGVGTGAMNRPSEWRDVRRILSHARYLGIRDERSVLALERAGLDRAGIHLGADLLFVEELRPSARPAPVGPARIGVSLPDADLKWLARSDSALVARFFEGLRSAARALAAEREIQLVLLGFQDEPRSRDLDVLSHVFADLGLPIERIDLAHAGLPEARAAFESLDLAIVMRFHAAVLALLSGTPIAAFSWDPKVLSLMAEVDGSRWCLDLRSSPSDATADTIQRAWNERAQQDATRAAGLAAMQKRARAAEQQVAALLRGPAPRVGAWRRARAIATAAAIVGANAPRSLRRRTNVASAAELPWNSWGAPRAPR